MRFQDRDYETQLAKVAWWLQLADYWNERDPKFAEMRERCNERKTRALTCPVGVCPPKRRGPRSRRRPRFARATPPAGRGYRSNSTRGASALTNFMTSP
jgi:hypothetical protein